MPTRQSPAPKRKHPKLPPKKAAQPVPKPQALPQQRVTHTQHRGGR
jgi:hypothetical protein